MFSFVHCDSWLKYLGYTAIAAFRLHDGDAQEHGKVLQGNDFRITAPLWEKSIGL